jgi:hypothetical protein
MLQMFLTQSNGFRNPEANGCYSAKSAYGFHFVGTIQQLHLEKIWKTKIEGKIKFSLWIL